MLTMGICVARDLTNIVLGTIKRVDGNTKTIVEEIADGTERTIKVTDAATVQRLKRRNANRGTNHRERG